MIFWRLLHCVRVDSGGCVEPNAIDEWKLCEEPQGLHRNRWIFLTFDLGEVVEDFWRFGFAFGGFSPRSAAVVGKVGYILHKIYFQSNVYPVVRHVWCSKSRIIFGTSVYCTVQYRLLDYAICGVLMGSRC